MAVTEHSGATPAAIAAHIAAALRAAIAARGRASLAVSGGKSPVPMFEALREQDLDWSKVTVVLVDERVVPRDHEASNTALVTRLLLQGPAAAAHFVPFFGELPAQFNAEVLDALVHGATERIADLPWPLDVAVLGMGEDAHTASLFPGKPALAETEALAVGEDAFLLVPDPLPPEAPFPRVSLTLSRLVAARSLLLMITGEAKRAVLEAARTRPAHEAPIHALLAATPDLAIHWSP